MPVIVSPPPLHPLEQQVLATLHRHSPTTFTQLVHDTQLQPDQLRRAIEWLRSKQLVTATTHIQEHAELTETGHQLHTQGLPERRLAEALRKARRPLTLQEARRHAHLEPRELTPALGRAQQHGWVRVKTSRGETHLELLQPPRPLPEENLLEALAKQAVPLRSLSSELRPAVTSLLRRTHAIRIRRHRETHLTLTPQGQRLATQLAPAQLLDQLTPELLATDGWQGRTFRALDVAAPTPLIHAGRKHPLQAFIDEVREIFIGLGFEELDGPHILTAFWNFDALFTPQDHPARELQDTFYLEGLRAQRVEEPERIDAVRRAHEDGGRTGSRGWGYSWQLEPAAQLVLRTHTTPLTLKYLADTKAAEARIFSVLRVFRNEKLTFKNLHEFYQIEGVVTGPSVTLRDLMGLLAAFYQRLGFHRVKFWPSYFPYTEPSLQSVVYYERVGKWVELSGMGIFRPEVTQPLGIPHPVLAWGGGLERLAMMRYNIDDARQLYDNQLAWLRGVPLCLL